MRRALGLALPVLALGVPVVWLGFNGGGFFAGTTGIAAVVAGLALVVWISVADRPLGAVTPAFVVGAAAFGGFAVWTLVSSAWSHAPARAVVEFDRALLYVLVVVLAGLAFPGAVGRRRLIWGFAAGAVVVTGAGLLTRLLPDVWPIAPGVQDDRLSYPVTYWNALGLLAAMAVVACVHVSSSEREPPPVRVLAAGLVPIPVLALLFTFSRAAIVAVPLGLIVYFLVARPRGGPGALVAIVPSAVLSLVAGLGADALTSDHPTSAHAVSQGHRVAVVLAACIAGAAVLRAGLLPLDARMARLKVSARAERRAWLGLAAAVVVGLAIAGAAGAPHWVSTQYHRFVDDNVVSNAGDRRARLLDPGNNGRLDYWRVSVKDFEASPLHGSGAGTFPLEWRRLRPYEFDVNDGHSLYVEVLGELGIVGLLLVVGGIVTLLVAAARRARGPDRAVGAAAFAITLVWALVAGLDWHWEMPVVTLPALAIGASMLGARGAQGASRLASPPSLARLLAGLCMLLVIVTPALVALSQRKIDAGLTAFRKGDCAAVVDDELSASSILSVRPEPFELLGYCDARLGHPALGVQAFDAAVKRDPGDWELYYGLAILQAADGLNPHRAAADALARNPRSTIARDLAKSLAGDDPRSWARAASSAVVPF